MILQSFRHQNQNHIYIIVSTRQCFSPNYPFIVVVTIYLEQWDKSQNEVFILCINTYQLYWSRWRFFPVDNFLSIPRQQGDEVSKCVADRSPWQGV